MVVLATRNPGKVAEVRRILGPEVELVALPADAPAVVESGSSFEQNALLKATSAARHVGIPALAEDSGLAVDALAGMPGIFSARWCGRHGDDAANLALLLGQLADVPEDRRGASFVCVAALVHPDGRQELGNGVVRGRLLREPRGEGGFGYDPVFVPDGYSLTTAELSPADKDRISHRGAALRALRPVLADPAWAGGARGGSRTPTPEDTGT